MSDPRVVMIGLDGATWRILRPWAMSGELPNLKRVIDGGATGPLRSTLPPLTPTGWTSAATGMSPGNHNVYSFFRPMRASYRRQILNSRDCRAAKIWQIANAYGKKAGIVHLPLTYPVDKVDGFMVSGMMTPTTARDVTWPAELLDELERDIPGYTLNVDTTTIKTGRLDEFLRDSIEHVRRHRAEMVHLMDRKAWDLFWIMFYNVDPVAHFFWKFMDPAHPAHPGDSPLRNAVLDIYREADLAIGEALDRLGPDDHLVLLSDHGMEPTRTNVHLTSWLIDNGYLVLRSERRQATAEVLYRSGFQRERLVYALKKLGLAWLPKLFPESLKDRVPRARKTFKEIENNVDWSATRAYFPSAGGRAIWINLKGREPAGIVEPDDYVALRDEIIGKLGKLVDADGRPVVRLALPRDEAYTGAYAADGPDIALLAHDGFYFAEGIERPVLRPNGARNTEKSGNHHLDGICAFLGPAIRAGANVTEARIIDIAPTVLHLLGLPVQRDMDGRPVEEAFRDDFAAAHPVRYDQVTVELEGADFDYSDDDRGQIEARLKEMGYM
ncbi:MAG TPA: alkaline phosphatase family protein [Blastocatellia bacterium]|nr:alkaline phosphatase family protein [Blastocatellia bacterium]